MLIAVAKWGITINTLFYVNRLSFFFLLYPLYSLPLSRENSEAWRERERGMIHLLLLLLLVFFFSLHDHRRGRRKGSS